jgi:hypothetical protein
MKSERVSGPFVWMARVGYVTRGLVFLIIGGFALLAAGGLGPHPEGLRDSLELIFRHPLVVFLLPAIGIGLGCFAGWRFRQSILDVDQHGSEPYGLIRRAMLTISGLFYVALALATVRTAFKQQPVNEDQSAREWTSWVMSGPLGRTAIALIAITFVGVAIGLAVKAYGARFRHQIEATESARNWIVALGSFGILTRAVVFLITGVFLGAAAYDQDSQQAVSLSGVLRAMQNQEHGGVFLAIAALGLLSFGVFGIIAAAVRRVHAPSDA